MDRGDLSGALLDGRYRVIERVAEGAMGVVYRAERVKLGRIVAIKVLHDVLPNELAGRKRFEIEAMAMAKLEHPHCASVLDVGVHNDRPFVVMDFIAGQNLKDVIATGPQPVPRAAEILRQVLSGLAHAHERGIIHRDIKPANIVLSHQTGLGDHVKILDFGLARLHDTGQNLTTGIVVGTPAYMAPEQIRGHALDIRVDVYACGVLLFELATGHKPFHSEKDDPVEVCRMHLSTPIPRLADKLPGVAFGELEGVVARALAKEREDRFPSAQAFAEALDAVAPRPLRPTPVPRSGPIAVAGVSSRPASDGAGPGGPTVEVRTADVMAAVPLERKRGRWAWAVALASLVVAGGGAAWWIAGRDADAPAPPSAPSAPAGGAAAGDPGQAIAARAGEVAARGDRDGALDLLARARRQHPDSAALPYAAGRIYFARLYWTEGLRSFRDAIQLDARYRTDPELIKTVLRGFITTPGYHDDLARFLRVDIGGAAQPFLEETARAHPNPAIRSRAAGELRRYRP